MKNLKADLRTLDLMDMAELFMIAGTMCALGLFFVILLGKLPA